MIIAFSMGYLYLFVNKIKIRIHGNRTNRTINPSISWNRSQMLDLVAWIVINFEVVSMNCSKSCVIHILFLYFIFILDISNEKWVTKFNYVKSAANQCRNFCLILSEWTNRSLKIQQIKFWRHARPLKMTAQRQRRIQITLCHHKLNMCIVISMTCVWHCNKQSSMVNFTSKGNQSHTILLKL